MKYVVCEFPFCELDSFTCRIHSHHIIPKSKNGSNHPSNLLNLCPTHHAALYVDGETHGIHSKKLIGNGIPLSGSIIVIRKLTSTGGICLFYEDCASSKRFLYYYNTKDNRETTMEV
jgi:hypothetical protein